MFLRLKRKRENDEGVVERIPDYLVLPRHQDKRLHNHVNSDTHFQPRKGLIFEKCQKMEMVSDELRFVDIEVQNKKFKITSEVYQENADYEYYMLKVKATHDQRRENAETGVIETPEENFKFPENHEENEVDVDDWLEFVSEEANASSDTDFGEEDSNAESYYQNDYPEEEDSGCGSDGCKMSIDEDNEEGEDNDEY